MFAKMGKRARESNAEIIRMSEITPTKCSVCGKKMKGHKGGIAVCSPNCFKKTIGNIL